MATTFDHSARRFGLVQGGGHGNFGEPPHNDGMEARLTALEEAVKGLPTKADFADLRADLAKGQADMHKAIADNHRWTHGALIGIATIGIVGVLGMMGTIWNMGRPVPTAGAATAQPPIIINVPAPAALPSPQPAPQQ